MTEPTEPNEERRDDDERDDDGRERRWNPWRGVVGHHPYPLSDRPYGWQDDVPT